MLVELSYCARLCLAVLFKLMQMQKVDETLLERLIDRFFELDTEKSGSLVLGVEVPNKDQVAEMKTMTEGTGMTLQEAWKKHLSKAYRLRAEVHLPGEVPHEDDDDVLDVDQEDRTVQPKNPAFKTLRTKDTIEFDEADVRPINVLPAKSSVKPLTPSTSLDMGLLGGIEMPSLLSFGFGTLTRPSANGLGTRV